MENGNLGCNQTDTASRTTSLFADLMLTYWAKTVLRISKAQKPIHFSFKLKRHPSSPHLKSSLHCQLLIHRTPFRILSEAQTLRFHIILRPFSHHFWTHIRQSICNFFPIIEKSRSIYTKILPHVVTLFIINDF